MKNSLNIAFASTALIIFTACSSLQVTEESISNQSVAGVTVSSKSSVAQAVLANAVVYFEYDKFTLTSQSIQALKGVVTLMQKNPKLTFINHFNRRCRLDARNRLSYEPNFLIGFYSWHI